MLRLVDRFLINGKQNTIRSIPILLVALLLVSMLPIPEVGAIGETIEMFRPTDDQVVIAGSEIGLQWRISGPGGYVKVSLSTDGGDSFDFVRDITNTPSHGFGWYDWTVPPNINSTTCKIKVQWRDNLGKPYTILATDTMDGNFTIEPGVSLTITESPDLVSYGRYYYLKWDLYDPHDLVAGLKIEWRTNDGSGWSSYGSLSTFYDWYDPDYGYIWWTPPYFESGNGQIRILAMSSGNTSQLGSEETGIFQVTSPGVTLLKPDGGVTMVAGSTYTIEWRTSSDPEQVLIGVHIQYSTNSGSTWSSMGYHDNDFSYDWTVPSISTTQLRVRVITMYGEWYYYASDASSDDNTIITDPNIPSVTLNNPNPPVAGGLVIGSGETYPISWSLTGYSNINGLTISLSTNNGTSYSHVTSLTSGYAGPYFWVAPSVDTYEAKIRISITTTSYGTKIARSNNPFYIFDTIAFANRPPVAILGPDQSVMEGDTVTLDGSSSYDPDGDPMTYTWTKISPIGREVVLVGAATSMPTFTVDLEHYPVNFVFELEVFDGNTHEGVLLYNVDRVSITVTPRGPEIVSFNPDTGWKGTELTVHGYDLMGAEVLIGTEVVASIPTSPTGDNPDPDRRYTLTINRALPSGSFDITVRTLIGEDTAGDQIEMYPEPVWQYENGIGFSNDHTDHYSYPWNPGDSGVYRDVFGNQIYLNIWICIGIPYWTPWSGWGCLGYEIEEPFAPDPLAAILYAAAFDDIGADGECFGMSTSVLEYYHGRIDKDDFGQTVDDWDELVREGDFLRHIRMRQGSQISAEILHDYLGTLINGLIPSTDYTGMGLLISAVKHSIDTGELGIMSLIDGGGHAVVPYAYEDRDGKTYFYVYDSNRAGFTDPESGNDQAQDANNANDNPPAVVIDRSGTYWDWSFEWPDGSTWGDDIGIGFVPYSTVVGDRTIPTSITGILDLLVGSASMSIEDEGGNISGIAEDGSILWGIPDASPLPFYGGVGDRPDSYFLPTGNYSTHISGKEDGIYNWSMMNNGSSAFLIENAEVDADSNDTVEITYNDGNPYTGEMVYSSADDRKEYDSGMVHNYGPRYRTFKVIGAELNDDGEHGDGIHVLKATDDYSGLIFENRGGGPTTFDVEFTTNVMSEDAWNGTDSPGVGYLPTATRSGITVGPGETVVLYPSNWMDLNNSIVIMEGETVPGLPQALAATELGGQVELTWDQPADDGGWPVIEFNIYRGDSTDSMSYLATVNSTSFTDTTTERGLTYNYSIAALNALGEGEMTPNVNITIPELTGPSVPLNFQGTLNDLNVTLTWNDPLDDGGMSITGFVIYRGTSSGELTYLTEIALVSEFIDGPLEKNTTYYYQLAAVNVVGAGVLTGEISISVPPDEPIDDQPPDDDEDGPNWMVFGLIALAVIILLVFIFIFVTRKGSVEDTGEE